MTPSLAAAFFIEIAQRDVETQNVEPLIQTMAPHVADPQPFHMGNFFFVVDGYNEIPDETYTIPAIRQYWQAVEAEWPYAIFFANANREIGCNISNIVFSVLKNITATQHPEGTRVDFKPPELLDYFLQHKEPLIELTTKAYPDIIDATAALLHRSHELLAAFGMEPTA